MRKREDVWIITIVCILLSFFVVKVFNNQSPGLDIGATTSIPKIQELLKRGKTLEQTKEELLDRLHVIEEKINKYEKSTAEKTNMGKQIEKQLWESRVLAGLTDLQGPGIEIILNDRKKDSIMPNEPYTISDFIVHDSDLLEVINELRAAGAEAIAVNGERILGTSRISCGGPTINVGADQRFTPPFIIHAIGDPDALADYFNQPESVYHILTFYGLEFSINKLNNIDIPRYYGDVKFYYAKPAKEGE
jgi:uncharacterized protein YlxW (UPF0749 family)